MSKRSRLRADRRRASTRSSAGSRRLTATVGGLVIGTLAARLARPVVHRLATRYGMPAGRISATVEMAVPLLVLTAVRRIARDTATPGSRRTIARRLALRRKAGRWWPGTATGRPAEPTPGIAPSPSTTPSSSAAPSPSTEPRSGTAIADRDRRGSQAAARPEQEDATASASGPPPGPVIDLR